ncbi:MAG: Branched-chain amino acid transport system permease protein LivM, partial [uncultured Acetobacteraceae bacterium]
RADDHGGRLGVRPAGGAVEGTLSRHSHPRGAVHPGGLLRPRTVVHRRRSRPHHRALRHLRLGGRPGRELLLRRPRLGRRHVPDGLEPDADARRAGAGGGARPLPQRRDDGHQPRLLPHALLRHRLLLRRHRRRALRPLPAVRERGGVQHPLLHPIPRDGHHRRFRQRHGQPDGRRFHDAAAGGGAGRGRPAGRQRRGPSAAPRRLHLLPAGDGDRRRHHPVPDLRAGRPRAALALDPRLLEALSVFAL